MRIIKSIVAVAAAFSLLCNSALSISAIDGVQPLQAYFTDDGKMIKVFTSESLDSNASLLIGNDNFEAESVASDVNVCTVFLIDNSTSMPYDLRDEIKTAISDYISVMPDFESIKIAMFDEQTTLLADKYSDDREFIRYELSKIDFQGQASLVYDAVLNVSQNINTSDDAYYRTVLITDGIDSVEGTSFDYLKNIISENSRFHVDVVQVSTDNKKDVNLTAIGNLGSNTYTLFNSGAKFDDLKPDSVSMIKASLNNAVTTGELKGVTIKNGSSNISLGSLMFPQVEIDDFDYEEAAVTEEYIEVEETEMVSDTTVTSTPDTTDLKKRSGGFPAIVIIPVAGGILLTGVLLYIFLIKKKKVNKCHISVEISKDDEADQREVGKQVWEFSVNSEFRVGRTLEPKSNDNVPLPKNDVAIYECATNDDISSIGRNAFSLTYDKKNKLVKIKNVAKGAVFSVESSGRTNKLESGNIDIITIGSRILIGNYTTITVNNITVDNG